MAHGNNKFSVAEMVNLYGELNGSHAEIARTMKCSRERVRQVLSPMGLFASHERLVNATKELADSIAIKFKEGASLEELCTEYKLGPSTIKRYLSMNDLTPTDHRYNPQLSNENLISLYKQLNGNYTKMAEALGIKPPNISRLIKDRGLRDECPSIKGRPRPCHTSPTNQTTTESGA